MVVIDESTGNVIADNVRRANNPLSRLIGLLLHKSVGASEGIWLADCPAVHTMGMRATIDIIYLDAKNRVVDVLLNARPNRPFLSCPGAKSILELGSGSRASHLSAGNVLRFEASHASAAVVG